MPILQIETRILDVERRASFSRSFSAKVGELFIDQVFEVGTSEMNIGVPTEWYGGGILWMENEGDPIGNGGVIKWGPTTGPIYPFVIYPGRTAGPVHLVVNWTQVFFVADLPTVPLRIILREHPAAVPSASPSSSPSSSPSGSPSGSPSASPSPSASAS